MDSEANLRRLADLYDPRLSRFAIDALVRLPFAGENALGFLSALVATAARHQDPRFPLRADEIQAAITTRIGRLAVRDPLLRLLEAALAAHPAPRNAT